MIEQEKNQLDLLELIIKLWDNKLIIIFCILFGFAFGAFTTQLKEKKYISTIQTSPNMDTSLRGAKIFELERYVFNDLVFQEWKNISPNTVLNSNDILGYTTDSQIAFLKPESQRLLTLQSGGKYIVNSDNPLIIQDIFKFIEYANSRLTYEYANQLRYDIGIVEGLVLNFQEMDGDSVKTFLSLNQHLNLVKTGKRVFKINPPLEPVSTSLGDSIVILISTIASLIVALFFLLIRELSKMRNN